MPAPSDDRVRFWAEQIRQRAAELKAKRESGAAADEPLTNIAVRGRRKALRAAEAALDAAQTATERCAAVQAMNLALKMCGLEPATSSEPKTVQIVVQEADTEDEPDEAAAEPAPMTQ